MLFSSVTLDNLPNLSGPQLLHVESVEGEGRGESSDTISFQSALCQDSVQRPSERQCADSPQSLTCRPVKGRICRLEMGCNEFSSLLSSHRKVYGWIIRAVGVAQSTRIAPLHLDMNGVDRYSLFIPPDPLSALQSAGIPGS